jgi:hypothetical protein
MHKELVKVNETGMYLHVRERNAHSGRKYLQSTFYLRGDGEDL